MNKKKFKPNKTHHKKFKSHHPKKFKHKKFKHKRSKGITPFVIIGIFILLAYYFFKSPSYYVNNMIYGIPPVVYWAVVAGISCINYKKFS